MDVTGGTESGIGIAVTDAAMLGATTMTGGVIGGTAICLMIEGDPEMTGTGAATTETAILAGTAMTCASSSGKHGRRAVRLRLASRRSLHLT